MNPKPAWLKALGKRELPERIELADRTLTLGTVFKNDFFAVTARYDGSGGDDGPVILKVNRQAPLFGLPMRWVGRFLASREEACFRRLADVEGIPDFIARWEGTGVVRGFVAGHAMKKGERVGDDFHDRLATLIDAIHDRGMAYVDLEKCENVLVGDDGRPRLFDFQIAWYLPRSWGGELWPARWLRRRFQNGDRYHLVKLRRRTRPDQMTPEQIAASYRRPWYIHVHRFITRPFTRARRSVLNRIDPRTDSNERGRLNA